MATTLGPLGQIARTVTDLDTSTRWYAETLGLPLLYRFEGMAFFDLGGIRLYLQQTPQADGQSILYFQVADIAAAHHDLEARGVRFLQAPSRVHTHADGSEEWMAFFADPDERPLALVSKRHS